jgi:hypothetical protein
MWTQPMLLVKNSGNTRFDHGAHGACCMICFSTLVHLALTAGVRIGSFFRLSIWASVFLFLYQE